MYKPDAEIEPTVEFPPGIPLTLQVMAVFVEFVMVALNCRVVDTATDAVAGATVTVTGFAAVTLRLTGVLVVPPRPEFVTVTGILVPT